MAFAYINSTGTPGGGESTPFISCLGANQIFVILLSPYPSTPSVTDSEGNIYSQFNTIVVPPADAPQVTVMASPLNATVVSASMNFTPVGPVGGMGVIAVSGSYGLLDQSASNGWENSNPPQNGGSLTPTQPDELILFAMGANASGAPTAETGTTTYSEAIIPGLTYAIGVGYQIQTTATAVNQVWNWPSGPGGTDSDGLGIVLSILSAPSGTGGNVTQSAIEIIALPQNVPANLTQSAIELVTINNPPARVTQSSIELITIPAPAPPHGPISPSGGPGTGDGGGGGSGSGTGDSGSQGSPGPSPATYPPGLNPVPPGQRPFPFVRCCIRNFYDKCLEEQANKERRITFPCSCTMPPGLKDMVPWDEDFGGYPVQSKPWLATGGIVTPTTAAGDTVMLTYRVPLGYDALFAGLFIGYGGTGFVQGSGDIVWRVRVNIHYPEDLGNVAYLYGTPQEPLPLTEGQIVFSNSLLQMIVNVPNLSGAIQVGSSRMYGGMMGFLWPRG